MPAELPEGRLTVIAAGKAAAAMMQAAERRARAPFTGLAVTRYGHVPPGYVPGEGIELIEAGHPEPDANGVRAGERALAIAGTLGPSDRLLLLLSGGGSALLAAPAPGVTLADKQALTRQLLASGAAIAEINCVRRHLSRVKGGRLAAAAGGARVTSWIVSDVPGDEASAVASGPGLADSSRLADAREILERYRISPPASVARALLDPANETPPALPRADFRILASARDALAEPNAILLGDDLQGEARELGAAHARIALDAAKSVRRSLLLSGGETVVTIANPSGRGGRNLEYLLALGLALDSAPGISAIACDTDGIDGNAPAAGAILRPDSLSRARALGLDPAACLAANDSFAFFEALGDLVVTGPTFTNVNDFRAILIDGGG
jgi:glycerate 2-kinase